MALYFQKIFSWIKRTFLKFPLEVLFVILGTVSLLMSTKSGLSDSMEILFGRISMVLFLAIPCFFSFSLFQQKFFTEKKYKIFSKFILFIIFALYLAYFINLPDHIWFWEYIRYVVFAFSSIMLLGFLPAFWEQEKFSTWKYFVLAFFSFVISFFYALVLFLWFVILLASIDYLFSVTIEGVFYLRLAIIVFCLFWSTFFLTFFWEEFTSTKNKKLYTKQLQVFWQYILMVLLLAYAVILYIYSFKIIITQNWPEHSVVWLIIWFGLVWILTFLILYPFSEDDDKQWIKTFLKYFRIVFLPIMIIYFRALFLRINEYGITINRYLVLIFWIWFVCISLYMLFSKKQDLKILPLSLFLFSIFAVLSPRNFLKVSEVSQLNKLDSVIEDNKFVKKQGSILEERDANLYSALRYLVKYHWISSIKHLMSQELLEETKKEDYYYSKFKIVADYIWLDSSYSIGNSNRFSFRNSSNFDLVEVDWYEYILDMHLYWYNKKSATENSDIKSYLLDSWNLKFMYFGEEIKIDLVNFVKNLLEKEGFWNTNLDSEKMILKGQKSNLKFKIIFENIRWTKNKEDINIDSLNWKVLLEKM